MKRREAARHERRTGIQAHSSAGDAALRAGDLYRVRVLESAEADRACKIYCLVIVPLPFNWRRHRLGDVSFFALKERISAAELTVIFCGCYCRLSEIGRASCRERV